MKNTNKKALYKMERNKSNNKKNDYLKQKTKHKKPQPLRKEETTTATTTELSHECKPTSEMNECMNKIK